jgi:acyl-coenzyme A thioesterase PaaI-like protein
MMEGPARGEVRTQDKGEPTERALMRRESLQERYAPSSVCFGCGPANPRGLRIRSVIEDGTVVARWTPRPYHHAFGEFLNGGIMSTILDCHSNWAAAYSLMTRPQAKAVPPTVTSSIHVEFLRPTPMVELLLEARVKDTAGRRVFVESTLKAEGEVTATLSGTFVAVGAHHPAASRWSEREERAPHG